MKKKKVTKSKGLKKKSKASKNRSKASVSTLDPKTAKGLAEIALNGLGDRTGAGYGQLRVVSRGKVKVLTFDNSEDYKKALRKVVEGKLLVAAL